MERSINIKAISAVLVTNSQVLIIIYILIFLLKWKLFFFPHLVEKLAFPYKLEKLNSVPPSKGEREES